VETIAKIRRAHFAQQKPIKAICREFRVSRKVVRKVIRSGATEFRYERGKQPLPRIDPWRGQLDGLLLANEGRSARERLTLIRIFEELRALGYEGSYDAVRRYVSELAVSNPGSRSIRRWQPQGLRLCVTSQMNFWSPMTIWIFAAVTTSSSITRTRIGNPPESRRALHRRCYRDPSPVEGIASGAPRSQLSWVAPKLRSVGSLARCR
jgi:hypothetical protein